MNSATHHLFSYGTLQKEEVQLNLFGRKLKGWRDSLPGYTVLVVEIKDESFLQKGEEKWQRTLVASGNKNDGVEGTVLELTEDELTAADAYEPAEYKRTEVKLQSGRKAWIYLAAPPL